MRLQLTRHRNGTGHTVTIVRDDGTSTAASTNVPAEHDLLHLAVETTLNRRQSFFGLVNDGFDLSDFVVAGAAQRLRLPVEAVQTEHIVNLLMLEAVYGERSPDFNSTLRGACESTHTPSPPPIDPAALELIRERFARYLHEWRTAERTLDLPVVFDE